MEIPSSDRPAGRHRASTSSAFRSALLVSLRLTAALGIACALGFLVFAETRSATSDQEVPLTATADGIAAADRSADERRASRSHDRTASPSGTPGVASPTPSPIAKKPAPAKASKPATTKPAPSKPAKPPLVAGLTRAQMDNAQVIVEVGRKLGIPRRGLIVAIATAMQESNLYNLANDWVPESLNYPHQGSGADHDSVGLFQQRPSSGWGAVRDLMRPAYAAERFYLALREVAGWEQMSVAAAAQAVQVSAFPDAYAKHEANATTVVQALLV